MTLHIRDNKNQGLFNEALSNSEHQTEYFSANVLNNSETLEAGTMKITQNTPLPPTCLVKLFPQTKDIEEGLSFFRFGFIDSLS